MNNEVSLNLLYKALADEFLASYQYWVCKNLSRGEGKFDADPEYDQHAKDEFEHAEMIMLRIKELGGVPISSPGDWTKFANPWEVVTTRDVASQLGITIRAEEAAIEFYKKAISQVRGKDETTLRLFRQILADEEEHLYDLQEVYYQFEDVPKQEVNVPDKIVKVIRTRITSRKN